MRKKSALVFIRMALLLSIALVGVSRRANAQVDYSIGNKDGYNPARPNFFGMPPYPCPIQDYAEGARSQYLYLASELVSVGMKPGEINAIKFTVYALNAAGVTENMVVKLGGTTNATLAYDTWEPLTGTVTNTIGNYQATAGVNTINLATPFVWNGTDNIVVEICNGDPASAATTVTTNTVNPSIYYSVYYDFNASHTYYGNNLAGGTACGAADAEDMGSTYLRPDIIFNWSPAGTCDATFGAATVAASATTLCGGDKVTLSWEGVLAKGMTYQWQYSTDDNSWTDIAAANGFTYVTTQPETRYYRVKITCGATTKYAASVKVVSPSLVSGNFTVNNALPASDPANLLFTSFNEVYNYIKCGINGPVVINVINNPTPYSEQLILSPIPGASTVNTVTFNGNNAVITAIGSDEQRAVIKLDGADHININNLVIKAGGTTDGEYGYGIHLLHNADSNTVKGCTITVNASLTSSNYAGIVVNGVHTYIGGTDDNLCDANTFENNTIEGGYYGVAFEGDAYGGIPIKNNKLLNNKIRNFYYYGIHLYGTTLTRVEGNDLSRPGRTSSSTAVYGISVEQINMAINVSGNRIHGFFDQEGTTINDFYGISFSNADSDPGLENVVSNNIIYDVKSNGTIYAIRNFGSNSAVYYHNTISLDHGGSTAQEPAYGFYLDFAASAIEIKNNIIAVSRGGSGLKYGVYMADPDIAMYTYDYNDYFLADHPTIQMGYFNGAAVATLADWRTATAQDAHSFNEDPGFVSASTGDFKPTSAIVNDKGTPVTVAKDILAADRSTTKPDMGAYEFTLPACGTSFLPGEAFSSLGIITCPDKNMTLNLKGNDVGLGLTYQWESATAATGTWSSVSTALQYPAYTVKTTNATLYYRAAVSCNGGTPVYSVPVQVTVGGAFPAGTYTIDKTQPSDPSGTKNFNSFKEAVAALSCGIAGPIVFNVKSNTYTEQIRITRIPGTSATNTITFKSESGNAADAVLKFSPADANSNYVVLLDSATNINFKNMTISADADETKGRMVVLLNTAAEDSILACRFNGPEVTDIITYMDPVGSAGIYGLNLKGGGHVIKDNVFRKASRGIYMQGASTTVFSRNNVIENNTFDSVFHQYIYIANASGVKVNNNTIPVNTALTAASYNQGVYGIYLNNCDSAYQVNANNITLQNNDGYVYGIRVAGNDATAAGRGSIRNNKVVGITNLSSMVHGIDVSDIAYTDIVNNEVSVASAIDGTVNYEFTAALVTENGWHCNFYNNSLLNTSAAPGMYNVAMSIDHQYFNGGGFTNINNNILANKGGGPAVFYNYTGEHVKSDYNLLYSSGAVLVKKGPDGTSFNVSYATIADWRKAYWSDMNSIVYNPAFTSNTDLQPLASDANSWALQGRGIQLAGNNVDKKGNARSVTLTDGVPDLGAYEFMPSVAPPALVATPAAPAAGTTQVFSMGSDTVTRITWAAGAPVPTAVTLKRYSGVLPLGLAATEKSLYYYVDAAVTGTGTYKFNVQQNFIDPWLRTLPVKSLIKLGKTNAANEWSANASSIIDSFSNIITDTALAYLGRFTGMTDGKVATPPAIVTTLDSSNKGTRFWAPYGLNRNALQGNGQQMKFVLAADVATEVTVSVNGTAYKKTYTVPAGGVITTDEVPKSGLYDACLRVEGLSDRGVLIESKNPIAATMLMDVTDYTYGLLLPAGTYAKNYTTLGARQFSGYPGVTMGTSWVNVIADHDSTVVEITPSGATTGGRAAGVPFRVTLNRGQVYQILGAFIKMHPMSETGGWDDAYECYDLTGTKVVAVPNAVGDCHAIAVFAGSSGTGIRCESNQNGADKYMFGQSYPNQAWGKHYLTAPLASRNSKDELLFNVFRVLVQDVNTVVKRNGTVLTDLKGNYYEFTSRDADYIEADKPVMMAQFMTYFLSCGNDEYSNPGSNENMSYLTPLGHGIKKATFYRKTGAVNYITAIVPDAGLTSLKIDGSSTFEATYAHPQKAGYSVVMKRWAAGNGVSVITCDTTFTANVHIPSNIYGFLYNIGFRIPRVGFDTTSIKNVYNNTTPTNAYTCVKTPFKPTVMLPVRAASLTWELSKVTGITPATDIVQNAPVPVSTVQIGFTDYYVYTLDQELSFTSTGTYTIPVKGTYNEVAGSCGTAVTGALKVLVTEAPVVDYTINYSGCINATASLNGTATAGNGAVVDRWSWKFGDNTTSTDQNTTKKWNSEGTYPVILQAIANDGCLNSVRKDIKVNALPVVAVVDDSLGSCPGTDVTFQVKDPATGAVYSWYKETAGGTALTSGTAYTVTIAGTQLYYVGALQNGCETENRVKVTAYVIPDVLAPVVVVDSVGVYGIRFKWAQVDNATAYQVSIDGGLTWITPSSGSNGLTHLVTGLKPMETVTILVRGIGGCKQNTSLPVSATTLSDKVFVPNSFSPNGDGKNDVLYVYGSAIKELKFMVFNQWGQKVFETADMSRGWDGTYNGKALPVGVYVYVSRVLLTTGQEINKKGSVNLIR